MSTELGTSDEYQSRKLLPKTPLEKSESEKRYFSAEKRRSEASARVVELERKLDMVEQEKQSMMDRVSVGSSYLLY